MAARAALVFLLSSSVLASDPGELAFLVAALADPDERIAERAVTRLVVAGPEAVPLLCAAAQGERDGAEKEW